MPNTAAENMKSTAINGRVVFPVMKSSNNKGIIAIGISIDERISTSFSSSSYFFSHAFMSISMNANTVMTAAGITIVLHAIAYIPNARPAIQPHLMLLFLNAYASVASESP